MLRYFFIIILIFTYVRAVTIEFMINPKNVECIGDYLTEDTVAIFAAASVNTDDISVTLKGPGNEELYKRFKEKEVRLSLTASESGNYQMCIRNNSPLETKIIFEFLSGLDAKDASEIATQESISPVGQKITKLKDKISLLVKDLDTVALEEEENILKNQNISGNILKFSFLTIAVMLCVGVVETLYLKQYLKKRKLI